MSQIRVKPRALVETLLAALVVASALTVAAPASADSDVIPDGRLAYVTTVNGHRAIFAIDLVHPSDVGPLVDLGDRDAFQPAWGPGGTGISFAAETSPDGPTAIFVAQADGSGIRQVTSPAAGESDSDPSWSPAGGEIAFARTLASGVSRILIVDVTTLDTRALEFPSLPSASEPDWSPDGRQVAFVAKQFVDSWPCETEPSVCNWGLYVANADGTGWPRLIGQEFVFDHHDPDWSPDGTRIAAGFGLDSDPPFSLVHVYATDGSVPRMPSSSGFNLSEPSWSPYGHGLVVTLGGGGISLLAIYNDLGELTQPLVADAVEPAWGLVEDTSPPTVTFSVNPDTDGWFTIPGSTAGVTLVDDRRVAVETIRCTLGGIPADIGLPQPIPGGFNISLKLFEGKDLEVRCSAADGAGNVGEGSTSVSVDYSPVRILSAAYSTNPKRVDEATTVTVTFLSKYPDGVSGEVNGLSRSVRMHLAGSELTAEIGTALPVGAYTLSVRVVDTVGRQVVVPLPTLAVYDPAAGSVDGTGWIVPRNSSDNNLPVPIDGTTKASFAFNVRYKTDNSTTPAGSFNFSYGKFRLQSEQLDWLVVGQREATFQGTATIRGMDGTYFFRVTARDGGADGLDTLRLEMWAPGAEPGLSGPLYWTSGIAGGQIQIRT